jgi:hypothetical protein
VTFLLEPMIDSREIAGVSVISSDLNTRTGAGAMSWDVYRRGQTIALLHEE